MGTSSVAGYSGTPLCKKLGIKEAHRVLLLDAPEKYESLLAPLPPGVQFVNQPDLKVDVAHVFATHRDELAKILNTLRKKLSPEAALWVSWPKKSAKVPTTITEDTIRELALPLGFGRYQGLRRHGSVVGAQACGSQGAPLKMRPNPSIERTSPGKPGAASHVKR